MLVQLLRRIVILSLIVLPYGASAQISFGKQANQRVFNKIEYHFNLGEADSIYALSAPDFRQSLPIEAFRQVFTEQLLPLGGIRSASMIDFDETRDLGSYKLDFGENSLLLTLGLTGERSYSTLAFKPYVPPASNMDLDKEDGTNKDTIDSKVHTLNDLIDLLALEYTRKPNTHALTIGILDNRNSSRYFYGRVAAADKRLPDENTLFEIGSISKTFTATILASMILQGQVDPDSAITTYLPDSLAANPTLQHITLKNLANHSSGLPRLPDNMNQEGSQDPTDPYGEYGTKDLFDFLKDYRSDYARGDTYLYSNLGFGLIGTILSEITGKTYQELIDEHITTRLQLSNTTAAPGEEQDFIPVHNQHGEPTPAWSFAALSGAGALKSTVVDLLTYAHAHFESPDSEVEHALALTRQFTFFDPPETDIGLAWHIHLKGNNLVFWHNGRTAGSSSYIALAPDGKKAVVVLSNADESVDFIGNKIMEALLNQK